MRLPSFIHNALSKYVFNNTPESVLRVVSATKSGKKASSLINREAITMQAKTLEEWKTALMLASDPNTPDRSELARLYRNLSLDNHLEAMIDNRIEPVQGTPFKFVDKSGKEVEEAKALFEGEWFIDFVRICMRSKFEGTKVVELFDLDENLHLKSIDEIPMSHILPSKGLILKEAGSTVGWQYKEGVLKNHYIQIGKDNYLGLFAQIAPIVFAKKLGIGSWLDYIEKYGVPPIFAITDREDQERLDQLYDALLNFRSNNFMVGRGQERFEIGKDTGSDAFNTFDKLIERANSEISKRIVGATGTSDEKSHVGAAKVHQDILATKYKLDKFFVKVVINNELIPRLVKLSPAYAVLANLKFDWDETETLNLKEVLEAVKSLSAYYEFDINELVNKTGLPITAIKNANQPTTPTEEANASKKKSSSPNAFKAIEAYYSAPQCTHSHDEVVAIDLTGWKKTIERIAKQLHSGKLKPAQLDKELIQKTYNTLEEAAAKGYGVNKFYRFTPENSKTVQELRQNIYRFSAAKTYQELKHFNSLLIDDTGKIRDFNSFKKEVLKVHETYNKNYLQAEYQTAKASAEMARKWERFQRNKERYPYLKYKTVGDSHVRDEHKKLDGFIAHIDDAIWDRLYPPNDWRCRCYVVQTDEPASTKVPDIKVKPEFALNVGKTNSIFNEDSHPYFTIPAIDKKSYKTAFEAFKLLTPYGKPKYIAKNGAKVYVHPFTDPSDLFGNYRAAIKLANHGIDVKIRPDVDTNILIGWKNPEYYINGVIGDRKAYKSLTNFNSKLKYAKEQSMNKNVNPKQTPFVVVIDLVNIKNPDFKTLKTQLNKNIHKNRGRNIKSIIIIHKNKVAELTREDIIKRDYTKLLKIQ